MSLAQSFQEIAARPLQQARLHSEGCGAEVLLEYLDLLSAGRLRCALEDAIAHVARAASAPPTQVERILPLSQAAALHAQIEAWLGQIVTIIEQHRGWVDQVFQGLAGVADGYFGLFGLASAGAGELAKLLRKLRLEEPVAGLQNALHEYEGCLAACAGAVEREVVVIDGAVRLRRRGGLLRSPAPWLCAGGFVAALIGGTIAYPDRVRELLSLPSPTVPSAPVMAPPSAPPDLVAGMPRAQFVALSPRQHLDEARKAMGRGHPRRQHDGAALELAEQHLRAIPLDTEEALTARQLLAAVNRDRVRHGAGAKEDAGDGRRRGTPVPGLRRMARSASEPAGTPDESRVRGETEPAAEQSGLVGLEPAE